TLATSVSIAGDRVQIAPSSDDLDPADGLTLAGTRAYAWVPPETPTLDVLPHDSNRTFPGATGTSFDGRQYFIPMTRIATRNPASRVPAVWVEPVGDAWSVRFTLQL